MLNELGKIGPKSHCAFFVFQWPDKSWGVESVRFLNDPEYAQCDRFKVWAADEKKAKAKAQSWQRRNKPVVHWEDRR